MPKAKPKTGQGRGAAREDWGPLRGVIQRAAQNIFKALLEIVTREGSRGPEIHWRGFDIESKTWCSNPDARHTWIDGEILEAIRACAYEIRLESGEFGSPLHSDQTVSISARQLPACSAGVAA